MLGLGLLVLGWEMLVGLVGCRLVRLVLECCLLLVLLSLLYGWYVCSWMFGRG